MTTGVENVMVPAESQDTLAGAGRLIADRYRLERKGA